MLNGAFQKIVRAIIPKDRIYTDEIRTLAWGTDALLVAFGVNSRALLDIISGAAEPYGLLPCQLPANMETVEAQCEDV